MSTTTATKIEQHVEKQLTTDDCTHCFAVPDAGNIIDLIHPITGRSLYCDETLEQIQVRYPGAQVFTVDAWCAAKAARQDSPVEWSEVTAEQFDEMLCCLPPAFWERGLFLVGEASDHHAGNGQPRFAAYRRIGEQHFASNRPMTIKEARAIVATL